MELSPGTTVDARYVVGSLLGVGGMARVYVARDMRLGIDVALKVLSVQSPSIGERLRNEGRVQAALKHPNVLSVTDIIEVGGFPGLVMELVHGPSLEALLQVQRLTTSEAEHLGRGIIEAVGAAHDHGVVHRDLKPANVLVARVGDRLVPKVADFGLVKVLGASGQAGTRSGATMGTPRYMAPEQVRDARDVDARADVFALGVVLYEMFTGVRAFDGTDTFEIFDAIVKGARRPVREVAELPDRIALAIEGCLRVDREERIPSCAALLRHFDKDGVVPAPEWRPSLVAVARDLAPSATPMTSSKTAGETLDPAAITARAGATLDVAAMTGRAPETWIGTAPPRARRRRRWSGLAAVAALGLIILAAVTLWRSSHGATDRFTVSGPPRLSDPPAIVSLVEAAWREVEANEDPAARRHVRDALDAGATDPAVHLLAGTIGLGFGDLDSWADHVRIGADLAEGKSGPVPELLGALAARIDRVERPSWWAPLFREHLARYPDDRLAALAYILGMCLFQQDVPRDDAVVASFVEASPDAVVGWVLQVELMTRAGQFDDARRVTEQALEIHAHSPQLTVNLAHLARKQGDMPGSLAAATEALRRDPTSMGARRLAAQAMVAMGDRDGLERLTAPMRVVEAPPEEVAPFAIGVASALESVGQRREAEKWWDWAEVASRAADSDAQLAVALGKRLHHAGHPWVATPEAFEAALTRLDQAIATSEASGVSRRHAANVSRAGHALLWLRTEQLPEEGESLGEIDAEMDPEVLDLLRLELARRDRVDEVLHGSFEGCHPEAHRGTVLMDLGDEEAAAAAFQSALGKCPADAPFGIGLAHAGLALTSASRGDRGAADFHLRALRATWPHADPDLPVLRRLARTIGPQAFGVGDLGFVLEERSEPLLLGLAPLSAYGVDAGEARSLDGALLRAFTAMPNVRAVALTDDGDVAVRDAGVDVVLRGELGGLGSRRYLNLERFEDGSVQAAGRAWSDAPDMDALLAMAEGTLVSVLLDDALGEAAAEIHGSVRRVWPDLRRCYESALPRDPTLGGRLELDFTILPTGKVRDARVTRDEVGDAELATCVVDTLTKLLFPATGQTQQVHYPFVFMSGG